MDSKTVVDNIYGKQLGLSDFYTIINDCIHLLWTNLMNSNVKFIRRQTNQVAHSLVREASPIANFRIFYNIPTCIESIIINEIH